MKQLERRTMDGTWVNCDEDNLRSNFYDNTLKYMESLGVLYLTIDNVKYRIVEAPREWWILLDGSGYIGLYFSEMAANEAAEWHKPKPCEVVHVKEVQ